MAHVLITGGSSGIGKASVERFFAAGYEVTFTYLSGKSAADALLAKLGGDDSRLRALHFDQGDRGSLDRLLESLRPLSPVDVAIANAGLGSATVEKVARTPHEQDAALLQVNAVGTLWLVQEMVAQMKARTQSRGKIILLSSVGGGITQFPRFRLADGMSKAAVAFLGRQLAAEQVGSGIDVFTICPGAVETAMFEASTLSKFDQAGRAKFVASLPKQRLIDPEEIADLALYLCKDEARVLHGAVLDASLGLGVHPGLISTGGH